MSVPEGTPDPDLLIPGLSIIPCTKRLYPGDPPGEEATDKDASTESPKKSQDPPAA